LTVLTDDNGFRPRGTALYSMSRRRKPGEILFVSDGREKLHCLLAHAVRTGAIGIALGHSAEFPNRTCKGRSSIAVIAHAR